MAEPLVLLPHPGLPPQEMALRTLAAVVVALLASPLLVLGAPLATAAPAS